MTVKEKIVGLISRLEVLPNEIADLQTQALTHNNNIHRLSESIISRELEIKSEINAATDENGKKLFSNEEARKIAFLTDSKDDRELAELYDSRYASTQSLDIIKIEIEKLSNEQRNIRAILVVVNLVTED